MTLPDILMLVGAGLLGGTISSLVGGAGLITFPALLATGLPPLLATGTNMVALTPGNFLAALYDRRQLPPFDRAFVGLVASALGGAALGALLLTITPERTFEALVPLLLGFATVLFACAGRISAWLRARAGRAADEPHRWGHSVAALLPVSVYGGYFGAGVGVLLLGVLSLGNGGDYRSANVTKNLVTSLNSVVASVLFAARGTVAWRPALAMMAGALVGALIGARLAQVVPHRAMRAFVIVVGVVLPANFTWRYWF